MKNTVITFLILLLSCMTLLTACSNDNNKTRIEKEYYSNGQLKTLKYYFKNDDIKVLGFMSNGTLSHIYNISNNNHDNFVISFDADGKIWNVIPYKNNMLQGKALIFDSDGGGTIIREEDYVNDKLVDENTYNIK